MDKFLDKIFFRSKNLNYISENIKNISENTPAKKIFDAGVSEEIRFKLLLTIFRLLLLKNNLSNKLFIFGWGARIRT